MRPLIVAVLLGACGDNRAVAPDASPDAVTCTRHGTTTYLHPIASVHSTLTHVTSPPSDDRVFAVQDDGVIRVIDHDELVAMPFLDVTTSLVPAYVGGAGQELGLLGLAFHPQFATNHTFFINYTADSGDPAMPYLDVTMRMRTRTDDPSRADPTTAEVVLAIPDDAANHNGGMLEFGPDGDLYIGTGDGGTAQDALDHGQNPHALLAKILRIDVDAATPYAIPADNPFADGVAGAPEVYILGVRNKQPETGTMGLNAYSLLASYNGLGVVCERAHGLRHRA
ncbi:MAG: PQQ-dependent sugar dehydrogenase, partial [Kofleriaceae bacterium]